MERRLGNYNLERINGVRSKEKEGGSKQIREEEGRKKERKKEREKEGKKERRKERKKERKQEREKAREKEREREETKKGVHSRLFDDLPLCGFERWPFS